MIQRFYIDVRTQRAILCFIFVLFAKYKMGYQFNGKNPKTDFYFSNN